VRIGVAVVEGVSMQPTLRAGDRVLLVHGRAPAPGQVAVVRVPGSDPDGPLAVKRVVRRDGAGVWVERDNPAAGADSWSWGRAVPDADVVGTVLLRLWPRPGRLDPRPAR
jgi:SOS-response transcriptional repressor LexA